MVAPVWTTAWPARFGVVAISASWFQPLDVALNPYFIGRKLCLQKFSSTPLRPLRYRRGSDVIAPRTAWVDKIFSRVPLVLGFLRFSRRPAVGEHVSTVSTILNNIWTNELQTRIIDYNNFRWLVWFCWANMWNGNNDTRFDRKLSIVPSTTCRRCIRALAGVSSSVRFFWFNNSIVRNHNVNKLNATWWCQPTPLRTWYSAKPHSLFARRKFSSMRYACLMTRAYSCKSVGSLLHDK